MSTYFRTLQKYILIITFFISFASYSQSESDGLYIYNYIKSTKEKWDFVVLKDTINAEIIYHAPAQALCGFTVTASITIVKTEKNEMIRVLDLCNVSDKYKIGQNIKIAAGNYENKDYSLPFQFVKSKLTGKAEAVPNYDLKVLKTVWGRLLD